MLKLALLSIALILAGAVVALAPQALMEPGTTARTVVGAIGGVVGFVAAAAGMLGLLLVHLVRRNAKRQAQVDRDVEPDRVLSPALREDWHVLSGTSILLGVGNVFLLGGGAAASALGFWLGIDALTPSVLYAYALCWLITSIVERGDDARLAQFAEHHPEAGNEPADHGEPRTD